MAQGSPSKDFYQERGGNTMKKERKLQTGNYLDGFEDLENEFHHVQCLIPEAGELAAIKVYIDRQTGDLVINSNHGELVVTPKAANEIRVNVRDF